MKLVHCLFAIFFASTGKEAHGEKAGIELLLAKHGIDDYSTITGEANPESDPCGEHEGAMLTCLDDAPEGSLTSCLGCVEIEAIVKNDHWCNICSEGAFCGGQGSCTMNCLAEYIALSDCRMKEHGCESGCNMVAGFSAAMRGSAAAFINVFQEYTQGPGLREVSSE